MKKVIIFRKNNKFLGYRKDVVTFIDNIAEKENRGTCKSLAAELIAFKFNFGKRLRVTGHEYRKTD